MLYFKNYIKQNKHLLFIFTTLTSFLTAHVLIYCNPLLFLVFGPVSAYFSSVKPDVYVNKIIDKVFEYSPVIIENSIKSLPYICYGSGGIVVGSIGILGGIKVAEFGYNWRFFANKYMQNTPVVGSIVNSYSSVYKWYTNKDLPNIEYTSFFSKIASSLGRPDLFNSKIIIDLPNYGVAIKPEVYYEKALIKRVEVEKPVYIEKTTYVPLIEYKDNENLISLQEDIRGLKTVVQESNLIHRGINFGKEKIIEELVKLSSEFNDRAFLTNIGFDDKLFLNNINVEPFDKESFSRVSFGFGTGSIPLVREFRDHVSNIESQYPVLCNVLSEYYNLDCQQNPDIDACFTEVRLYYKVDNSGWFSVKVIDPENCEIATSTAGPLKLIDAGLDLMVKQGEIFNDKLNPIVLTLEEKISSDLSLLNKETLVASTQTNTTAINEILYNEVKTYLNIRDWTSLDVASNYGSNLHFEPKGDILGISANEIKESNNTANFDDVDIISNLLQNPGLLFTAALCTVAVDNLHTIHVGAETLLNLMQIPGFEDAFSAAYHMGVLDYQNTYHLSREASYKARDIVDLVYNLKYPESLLSDISNNSSDVSYLYSWKTILIGAAFVVTMGVGIWYLSETGDNATAQAIVQPSQDVITWRETVLGNIKK